jgi:hypothetical protein
MHAEVPNDTGFCCNATALTAILLHNARSHCQQQPGLDGNRLKPNPFSRAPMREQRADEHVLVWVPCHRE